MLPTWVIPTEKVKKTDRARLKVDRDVPDGAGGGGAEGSQCWRGQFYFISNSLLYNLEGEFYLNINTLQSWG